MPSNMLSLRIALACLALTYFCCSAHPPVVQMSVVEPSQQHKSEGGKSRDNPVPRPLIGRKDGHDSVAHGAKYLASLPSEWAAFKKKFNKVYKSARDEYLRMLVFARNLFKITQHNIAARAGRKSYTLGVNEFADMTSQEFKARRNGFKGGLAGRRLGGITYMSPATKQSLPDSIDWRSRGAVTPVKDQGSCGSCWSFSTTGALEGQNFRKTGKLLSLSEQQLVDCSGAYGNQGCNGGLMDMAFKYIKQYGIESESVYKYKAEQGTCRYKKSKTVANCTGFVDIPQGSEEKLKEAVANIGPVSVAIDASHSSFQLYQDGVYDESECSSTELDHGVLVVGYGTTSDGVDYWLVKNSWNTHWGDKGYIKMARNKENQCGIASSASYPTV